MAECSGFEIICPDGDRRHFPYHNHGDAKFDAEFYSVRACCVPAFETSECPQGEHTVRPIVFACARRTATPGSSPPESSGRNDTL